MSESNGSTIAVSSIQGGETEISDRTRVLRPLTSRQERKLVDYLDENFLQLTRNFKKRSEESSKLKTLSAYLEESRRLLAFILQIPPVDPSTSLRISYMLRLTGETLGSIQGYRLGTINTDVRAALQDLVDFLDDLDQAWLAVLRGHVWDPISKEGVDVTPPVEDTMEVDSHNGQDTTSRPTHHPPPFKSSPPSQTDLTRLRSLLLAGEATLEEWLTNERGLGEDTPDQVEDLSAMLDRMGLLQDFDALFVRTLDYLGGFGGDVARNIVDPEPETQME